MPKPTQSESQIITHPTWNPLIKQREISGKWRSERLHGGTGLMSWSVAVFGWVDWRQWFDVDQMRKMESEVRVRATKDNEREKITKILNASATITVHICTVTEAIVHLCIFLHSLMWIFFWWKCVKWRVFFFCILQDFAPTNVDALSTLEYSCQSF